MNSNHRFATLLFLIVIAFGLYSGVRYLGTTVHYACEVPEEDCPPPFRLLGDLGWFVTGGDLVPFWTKK